jgi:hypothetical protein
LGFIRCGFRRVFRELNEIMDGDDRGGGGNLKVADEINKTIMAEDHFFLP